MLHGENTRHYNWRRGFVSKPMAGKVELPPFATFDPVSDPTSLSQRWKSWKRRFEIYLTALNITEAKQQRALLLYQVGQATQEIFDTLPDTGDDYVTAMTKLNDYFSPTKNVDYEIFQFRKAMQQPGETTNQFATRLKKLAATCEFTNVDKEVKSTIIQNCFSKRLRRVALRDDLSLADLLQEASEVQAKGMEEVHAPEALHLVLSKHPKHTRQPQARAQTLCRFCGYQWPHRNGPCPAQGQTCRKCGKLGHFFKVCRSPSSQPPHLLKQSSQVHQVSSQPCQQPSDSSEDEYLYTLGDSVNTKTP